MPKRPAAGDTAMRWLVLLDILGTRGHTTSELVDRLADEGFEVSKRTVERDLNALSLRFPLLDRPGDNTPGHARLWHLDVSKRKLIPGLRRYEALAFDFLEQYTPAVLPGVVHRELAPFFQSAIDELRRDSEARLGQWRQKVYVASDKLDLDYPDPPHGVAEVILDALFDNLQFDAQYKPRARAEKHYTLHPAGLFYRGTVGYLIAYRTDMPNYAIYALHRFLSAQLTTQEANIPEKVNVRRVAEDFFVTRRGDQIRLKLKIHEPGIMHHLSEARLGVDQVVADEADYTLLTVSVADTEELRYWLRGYLGKIEVVEPESLREQMKRDAEIMFNRYRD